MAIGDGYLVFAGTYDDVDTARADFDDARALHKDRTLGGFEAAVFEKTPSGEVKVLDTAATSRATGAKAGAIAGAALGVLFPAALVIEAASGAAFGALTGNLVKWMSGHQVKELASMLESGEAGVVLVGDADFKGDPDALLGRAKSVMQRCFSVEEVDARAAMEAAEAE